MTLGQYLGTLLVNVPTTLIAAQTHPHVIFRDNANKVLSGVGVSLDRTWFLDHK